MTDNNVVDFAGYRPSAHDALPELGHDPVDQRPSTGADITANRTRIAGVALQASGRAALTVAKASVLLVRMSVFFVMRWLRGPITLLLGLVSAIGLLSALIVWVGFTGDGDPGQKHQLLAISIISGIGASILRFSYDYVLAALGPKAPEV